MSSVRTATNKRLILLTSGWSKPDWAWLPFMRLCKENGYDVLRLRYPYRGFAPIQYSAKATKDLVEAVRPEYSHITFVGHSMGGLIGRYLIQRTDVGRHIDAYVSIGTPHHGTYMAYLAPWSRSACQMRPRSPFLQRLDDCAWPDVPALTIKGALEEVVIPQSNASFDHASDEVVIPRATHASLLFNDQTFWEMWAWLTFEVFGEPGPLHRDGQAGTVEVQSAAVSHL